MSENELAIEYTVGKKRFFLNKTEIRCIDSHKPKNNFTVLLGDVMDSYEYKAPNNYIAIAVTILVVLFLAFLTWNLYTLNTDFLIKNSKVLSVCGFSLIAGLNYVDFVTSYVKYYEFYFKQNGKLAFSIPLNKKFPDKTEKFIQLILDRITKTSLTNENILDLLIEYSLLTQMEFAKLEMSIQNNADARINHAPVVIQIKN